ncbi:MAG: methyltransferase domain-containing protein [Nanoarchaeota archaeon]|nr:methyltransferase domain-containing protein [Nanoarchaeota archaeon]
MNLKKENTKVYDVYEAEDDSKLLLDCVLKDFSDIVDADVCEVGVGSGFVIFNFAKECLKKGNYNNYFGCDINLDAINSTLDKFEKIEGKFNLDLRQGNLLDVFAKDKKKFDLIFFNTPYLPCEDGENYDDLSLKDKAIYGGKKGYEIIVEFILQIDLYLKDFGVVLILVSSLSNLDYIKEVLMKNSFSFEIVSKQGQFFEELFVLRIWKSHVFKLLEKKEVKNLVYFAHGKHSIVLSGMYKGKRVVVKHASKKYIGRELLYFDKLDGEDFLPKIYFRGEDYIVMEKFEGKRIDKFLLEAGVDDTLKVLKLILDICFRLDKLGINKTEMCNPYKHIFVEEDLKIKMIDYERCLFGDFPKNATQFLQYLKKNTSLLRKKGIELDYEKIHEMGKRYSKNREVFDLKEIIKV